MKTFPMLRGFRAAFVFLTRIPVGGFPYPDEAWRWSSAFFPVVGSCLGGGLALVFLALQGAGAWPAAWVTLAVSLLVTGAFHEDGLADTADALGGGYTRDRVLEILKDSRIGTFGAVALIVNLGLKAALLVELGPRAPWALIVAETVSRAPPVILMVLMPYATDPDRSRSRDVTRGGPAQGLVALVWSGLVLHLFGFWGGLFFVDRVLITGVIGIVTALLAWRFHRRVGGITGDFLGATQQIIALVVLLTWTLCR